MGLYDRYILPPLIDLACGARPMMREREKIVSRSKGVVLEVGAGSGLNTRFYDAATVTHIHALDPSPEMLERYRRASEEHPVDVTLHAAFAEDIPLEADSVDTIVLTFTLCTIPSPLEAIREMNRVLKPAGTLLFCEHGLSPDPGVQRWQHRLDRPWGFLAGGCHLNRDIPGLIREGGFEITELDSHALPKTPKIAGFVFRGEARRPSA
jgi:SAM-dependent methyltransferase